MERLDNKTVVVTGATDGIGRVVAQRLADAGAELVIVARHGAKASATLQDLRARALRAGGHVEMVKADLARLADVTEAAQAVRAQCSCVDILINNAGVMKNDFTLSPDGWEMNIAVNHLAVQSLTLHLLDRLLAAPSARVVNVNSAGHAAALRGGEVAIDFATWREDPAYEFSMAYSRSKLANLMFSYELASRLARTNVTVNALHPGSVRTALGRELSRLITEPYHLLFSTTVEKGADPVVHVATSRAVAGISGAYFDGLRQTRSSARSYDKEMWHSVWYESARATGVGANLATAA